MVRFRIKISLNEGNHDMVKTYKPPMLECIALSSSKKSLAYYQSETVHSSIMIARVFTGIIIGWAVCYLGSILIPLYSNAGLITLISITLLAPMFIIITKSLEAWVSTYLLKKHTRKN